MSQNLVSLDITDAQVATALDAMIALEGALTGLISLENKERRSLTKMGRKSEFFCRQTLCVLTRNPQPAQGATARAIPSHRPGIPTRQLRLP